jgi:hypothetical protein
MVNSTRHSPRRDGGQNMNNGTRGELLSRLAEAVGSITTGHPTRVAVTTLSTECGKQVFTVREVFDRMTECGTTYAEGTVFKTMQRMKEPPTRPPYTCLERVGRQGFRLVELLGRA